VLSQPMHADTEALLVFAARAEHVRSVITPALASGTWVICDRFTDSTYAYQCGGRGISPARIAALETFVHPDLAPQLTLLFDAPVAMAQARVAAATPVPDKFEREQSVFFARVREAYLARASAHAARTVVIDSSAHMAQVRRAICAAVTARLGVTLEST
jgi:dTMP kinase